MPAADAILYLDFDGVLHPENVVRTLRHGPQLSGYPGHALFEHVPVLHEALAPYPNLRIVLSTSWVKELDFRRARDHLGPLAARVIGATYHSQMRRHEFEALSRGMQIFGDVTRRQPRAWLALDDDDWGWPAWARDQLIKTDDEWGIRHPDVWARFQARLPSLA